MPLSLPTSDDCGALADWAELLILTSGTEGISIARIGRLIEGYGIDRASEEIDSTFWEEEGSPELDTQALDIEREALEVKMEGILAEIELRLRLGPRVYAFTAAGDRILRREAAGASAYIFLLVISAADAPFRAERRAHEVEAAFDGLALEALRRYLGRGSVGVRFARNAHRADDNSSRPAKFRDAVDWLRGQLRMGRGHQQPEDEERSEHWEDEPNAGHPPLNSYSDGGVDVVAWWRFKDERPGAPVLLGQCTVQLEWAEKVADIKLELWKKWVDFETVPPQTALVLPFAVSRTSSQWANRTITAGVILDRLRLMELLDELSDEELSQIPDEETQAWIQNEISALA